MVFVDESGFSLLPAAVRTYAPRGQTPILRVPRKWDRLSVISAITPAGRLLTRTQTAGFNGATVVQFLQHLLRQLPGKLLVIWDGLPAHRSAAVKTFLKQGAAARLHLEPLPPYAPDLNPDEGIWRYLKHVELANVCCYDLAHLGRELRKAIARLRHKTDVIRACFREAGLAL